jgi:hypothetical protein
MEIGSVRIEGKIYERLCGVMAGIRAVAKERDNKVQGYKFRGIDDVYNMIQPVLAENKVFIVPKLIEMIEDEKLSKSGGILYYTTLKMEYSFYTDDGSCITTQTIGKAMDSGDKSLDKAKSANMKYLLLQMFLIPTEEEKDTEEDRPETKNKGKSKSTLETLKAKYFKLTIENDEERHKWQLDNIGKASTKEWTESDFQKAIDIREKKLDDHKPTALESLKSNLDTIKTMKELNDKWTKNKKDYESNKNKESILELFASRKKQLTLELLATQTGLSAFQIDEYIQQAGDIATLIAEALTGNVEAVTQLKNDIATYLDAKETEKHFETEEQDLADMEDARASE